jgi:energy-converting hydrogenase A subunit M
LETISLDDKKAIVKKYKLRTAGAQNATIEITLPKDAVEREARALGISEEAVAECLIGVWRYNSFRGLHLDFEVRKEQEAP